MNGLPFVGFGPGVIWYGYCAQINCFTTMWGFSPHTEGLTFMLYVEINPTASMARNQENERFEKGTPSWKR